MGNDLLLALYQKTRQHVKKAIAQAPFATITVDGFAKEQGKDHLLGFCVALATEAYFLDYMETGDAKVWQGGRSAGRLLALLGVRHLHALLAWALSQPFSTCFFHAAGGCQLHNVGA